MFTGEPTQFLKLPQFNPEDHPDFLTDFNNAFIAIDQYAIETNNKLQELQEKINRIEYERS